MGCGAPQCLKTSPLKDTAGYAAADARQIPWQATSQTDSVISSSPLIMVFVFVARRGTEPHFPLANVSQTEGVRRMCITGVDKQNRAPADNKEPQNDYIKGNYKQCSSLRGYAGDDCQGRHKGNT